MRHRRAEEVTVVDAVGHASGGQIAPALDVTRTLAQALDARAVLADTLLQQTAGAGQAGLKGEGSG